MVSSMANLGRLLIPLLLPLLIWVGLDDDDDEEEQDEVKVKDEEDVG